MARARRLRPATALTQKAVKLPDRDSSLAARKDLANDSNVHVGAHGCAEQNIALHEAVIAKIAENGGKVLEGVRH